MSPSFLKGIFSGFFFFHHFPDIFSLSSGLHVFWWEVSDQSSHLLLYSVCCVWLDVFNIFSLFLALISLTMCAQVFFVFILLKLAELLESINYYLSPDLEKFWSLLLDSFLSSGTPITYILDFSYCSLCPEALFIFFFHSYFSLFSDWIILLNSREAHFVISILLSASSNILMTDNILFSSGIFIWLFSSFITLMRFLFLFFFFNSMGIYGEKSAYKWPAQFKLYCSRVNRIFNCKHQLYLGNSLDISEIKVKKYSNIWLLFGDKLYKDTSL